LAVVTMYWSVGESFELVVSKLLWMPEYTVEIVLSVVLVDMRLVLKLFKIMQL